MMFGTTLIGILYVNVNYNPAYLSTAADALVILCSIILTKI